MERKVRNQKKSAEAAASKAESLREAASKAEEQAQESARIRDDLQREVAAAEQELLRMCQSEIQDATRSGGIAVSEELSVFESLAPSMAGDAEAMRAFEVFRAKITSAKEQGTHSEENLPAPQVQTNSAGSGLQVQMDVDELERQATAAKRAHENAEERFQSAKTESAKKPRVDPIK